MNPAHAAAVRKVTWKVGKIYGESNGEATRLMYQALELLGPAGVIGLNLFRACKASARAKVYRGGNSKGRFRDQAYEKKQWSMDNLCKALMEHSRELKIAWGWRQDPNQAFHNWVLYVDLPKGQASFHTDKRGAGPEYYQDWDGTKATAENIIDYCQNLLSEQPTPTTTSNAIIL